MTQYRSNFQRIAQARINIEPMLHNAVERAAKKENLTMSTFVRNLLLREMLKRGEITSEQLIELAS